MNSHSLTFAPYIFLKNVSAGIDFYQKAFGAVELRRVSNPDKSVHVVEMAIDGALFHIHEERPDAGQFSPESLKGTSSQIGIFTNDPDSLYHGAIAAGGRIVNTIQDYDYGYRQGTVADPFGHQWLLEKKIHH